MIACGRLCEFVTEFASMENDRRLWELYLHKVFDNRSFADFKASVMPAQPEEDLETTVNTSRSILESFVPTGAGKEKTNGAI